ncbi:MAG: DUF2283 domain-containing protein [Patescibacteria group bacterium]
MKINYDKYADALYIEFKKAKAHKTVEERRGVLVDFDKKGTVLGIEVLNYSKTAPTKERLQVSAGKQRIAIPAV